MDEDGPGRGAGQPGAWMGLPLRGGSPPWTLSTFRLLLLLLLLSRGVPRGTPGIDPMASSSPAPSRRPELLVFIPNVPQGGRPWLRALAWSCVSLGKCLDLSELESASVPEAGCRWAPGLRRASGDVLEGPLQGSDGRGHDGGSVSPKPQQRPRPSSAQSPGVRKGYAQRRAGGQAPRLQISDGGDEIKSAL